MREIFEETHLGMSKKPPDLLLSVSSFRELAPSRVRSMAKAFRLLVPLYFVLGVSWMTSDRTTSGSEESVAAAVVVVVMIEIVVVVVVVVSVEASGAVSVTVQLVVLAVKDIAS